MSKKSLALALTALAAVAVMSACAEQPPSTPPPSPLPVLSASDTPVLSASDTPVLTLGPDGLGPVKLGQPFDEARKTGLVSGDNGSSSDCTLRGRFKAADVADTAVDLGAVFAGKLGVTAIYAYEGIATAEGVALGTSFAEMKKAYPSWKNVADGEDEQTSGRGLVPVPGNPAATYRIVVQDGKVTSLAIQLANQDCYE